MQGDRKQGLCCSGLQHNSLLDQGSLQPAALQLLTTPSVTRFVGSVSEQCEPGAFTPSHSAEAGGAARQMDLFSLLPFCPSFWEG